MTTRSAEWAERGEDRRTKAFDHHGPLRNAREARGRGRFVPVARARPAAGSRNRGSRRRGCSRFGHCGRRGGPFLRRRPLRHWRPAPRPSQMIRRRCQPPRLRAVAVNSPTFRLPLLCRSSALCGRTLAICVEAPRPRENFCPAAQELLWQSFAVLATVARLLNYNYRERPAAANCSEAGPAKMPM